MDLGSSVHGEDSLSTSAHSVLAALSSEDIDLLDTVATRASSATTFPTVFKAYNEVLQERGLDPAEDTLYYKFLLKLGVVKGRTWGEKWSIVKSQYGFGAENYDFLHSSNTADRYLDSHTSTIALEGQSHVIPPNAESTPNLCTTVSKGIQRRSRMPKSEVPENEHAIPFHHIAKSDVPTQKASHTQHTSFMRAPQPRTSVQNRNSIISHMRSKEVPATQRTIEDDPWRKIKMATLEPEADRFRTWSLLQKCFSVWQQGAEWMHRTQLQVTKARSKIILFYCLEKWHLRLNRLRDMYNLVNHQYRVGRMRRFFESWKKAMRRKLRVQRKRLLAQRLSDFQIWHSKRLPKAAWMIWGERFQYRVAGQYYSQRLCRLALQHWKQRMSSISALNLNCVSYIDKGEQDDKKRVLETWKLLTRLRASERTVAARCCHRMLLEAFLLWNLKSVESLNARRLYDIQLTKRSLMQWLLALRTKSLNMDKAKSYYNQRKCHALRQQMMIWVTKERHALLQRVLSTRRLRATWSRWRTRLEGVRRREDYALQFTRRKLQPLKVKALRVWVDVHRCHVTAGVLSDEFRSAHLRESALYAWRVSLRSHLKRVKYSRAERRLLLMRRAWKMWKQAILLRHLSEFATVLERMRQKQILLRWRQAVQTASYLRQAVAFLTKRQDLVLASKHLHTWTKRVIDIKERELITVEQRSSAYLRLFFTKWKSLARRNSENISLMDSFISVKTEDTMRRCLVMWHAASRKKRQQRLTLQRREREVNQSLVLGFWERWRGRLAEEQLRPLEREMQRRIRATHLLQLFMTWKLKTQTVPAIRMFAMTLKRRVWRKWRTVIPVAIKARAARDFDRRIVQRRAFRTWSDTVNVKITLRSMARDRYRRLISLNQNFENKPRQDAITVPVAQSRARGESLSRLEVNSDLGRLTRNQPSESDLIPVRTRGLKWFDAAESRRAHSLSNGGKRDDEESRDKDIWTRLKNTTKMKS